MIEVQAPTGERVILDREVYDSLQFKSISMSGNGYAQIFHDGKVRTLHSVIMGVGNGTKYSVIVDHINRDKLDNRRENLRLLTPAESNLNRKRRVRKDPSIPPCVAKHRNKYVAIVQRNRIRTRLGSFETMEEADAAVKKFKTENDGEFA